jgi:hypothetical protein
VVVEIFHATSLVDKRLYGCGKPVPQDLVKRMLDTTTASGILFLI